METASSKKEVTGFKQASHRFKMFADEISICDSRIGLKAAEELKADIIDNYNSFVSSLPNDPQNRDEIAVWVVQEDDGRFRVGVTGDQVIYDEFGTGTQGENNPHPEKGRYMKKWNLDFKDYNEGDSQGNGISYIRTDKNGVKYWMYDGQPTYGVPSGQFIYRSLLELADYKAKQIALDEIIKAKNKTMKGK